MKKTVVLFLIMIFTAGQVLAADVPAVSAAAGPKAALNDLLQEALKNNPRLKAARYRADAAKARVGFLRGMPDPMLEYEHDRILPSMISAGKVRPMKSLSISQRIPFPTKLFMLRKAAGKEADAFEEQYKETVQSVIKDVKTAYFNLFLDRRKAAFMKDAMSLMGQFVEVINKKYAVNKAGQQDVLRAQVEYSRLSNMHLLYEKEAAIANSLLVSLLGRDDGAMINIPDSDPVHDQDLNEDDIVALAKKNRPELRSVRDMLEKARASSSLSKQALLPDITLKYKRNEKDGKFSGLDEGEWMGGVAVNVPFWFWGKQLPEIREARAELEAAKADYKAAENTAVFEARSAFARYQADRDLVAAYETGILPQATSAVMTARRAYESGTLSFLELLDSLRMLRQLQIEYFKSVAELQISLADLEQSVGGRLEP